MTDVLIKRELLERLAEWDQFPHKMKDALTELRAILAAPRQPEGEAASILLPALRQYMHNDGSGLLAGYEYERTQQIVAELREECERLHMQLSACGVVALANTPESAGKARQMHPDYMSASCSDVADAVDREMALRQQLAERDAELSMLRDNNRKEAIGVNHLLSQRDKLAGLLRELRETTGEYAWGADLEQRIDSALAEVNK